MFVLTSFFVCFVWGWGFCCFLKIDIGKSLIFCDLSGDHIEVFLHCAEGKTDCLASMFTMPLYSKLAQEGSQRGEWADDDNLFSRTSRNLVTH